MREFSRSERVAGQIQRELAAIIQRELRDPRVGLVAISAVTVTHDLAHAKVYVRVLEKLDAAQQTVDILNRASGYIRHALGQRIVMRVLPQLKFVYDISADRGERLMHLIDKAMKSDHAAADEITEDAGSSTRKPAQ